MIPTTILAWGGITFKLYGNVDDSRYVKEAAILKHRVEQLCQK